MTTILLVWNTPNSWKRNILVHTLQINDHTVDRNNILQAALHFESIDVISVRRGMVCDAIHTGRKKSMIAVMKSVQIYDHVAVRNHSKIGWCIENVMIA